MAKRILWKLAALAVCAILAVGCSAPEADLDTAGTDPEALVARALQTAMDSISYDMADRTLTLPEIEGPGSWSFDVDGIYHTAHQDQLVYDETFQPGASLKIDLSAFDTAFLTLVWEDGGQKARSGAVDLLRNLNGYTNREVLYADVVLPEDPARTAPQEVAADWVSAWGAYLLALPDGHSAKTANFQVLDCGLAAMPGDGSLDRLALTCRVALQFPEPMAADSVWHLADTEPGAGQWDGWQLWTRDAVLERQDGGWRCTYLGTAQDYARPEWQAVYGDFQAVLTDAQLEELTGYFSQRENNGFLSSLYSDPRDVYLPYVFYDGAGLPDHSGEEAVLAQLETALDITCLAVSDMDTLLREKTGYGWADMHGTMEGWTYLEDLDYYGLCHGDTAYQVISCTGGYLAGDGSLAVEYTGTATESLHFYDSLTGSYAFHNSGLVTVMPEGDGYRFLSNQGLDAAGRV